MGPILTTLYSGLPNFVTNDHRGRASINADVPFHDAAALGTSSGRHNVRDCKPSLCIHTHSSLASEGFCQPAASCTPRHPNHGDSSRSKGESPRGCATSPSSCPSRASEWVPACASSTEAELWPTTAATSTSTEEIEQHLRRYPTRASPREAVHAAAACATEHVRGVDEVLARVVAGASLRVRERLVGLGNVLEAVLCLRVVRILRGSRVSIRSSIIRLYARESASDIPCPGGAQWPACGRPF